MRKSSFPLRTVVHRNVTTYGTGSSPRTTIGWPNGRTVRRPPARRPPRPEVTTWQRPRAPGRDMLRDCSEGTGTLRTDRRCDSRDPTTTATNDRIDDHTRHLGDGSPQRRPESAAEARRRTEIPTVQFDVIAAQTLVDSPAPRNALITNTARSRRRQSRTSYAAAGRLQRADRRQGIDGASTARRDLTGRRDQTRGLRSRTAVAFARADHATKGSR